MDRSGPLDVERTWEVMRRFAAEDVEDAAPRDIDGDGILAQYGIYSSFGGGKTFQLDMTRQFMFYDEDDEYDHMSQLNCTFEYAVTDELRALGESNLWSFGLDLDEFFARALALPGFRGVREAGAVPARLDVDYSDV